MACSLHSAVQCKLDLVAKQRGHASDMLFQPSPGAAGLIHDYL
jgi:hypothetical protein